MYTKNDILLSEQRNKANFLQGILIRRYIMKGYTTPTGYMGYVEGTYILFASEEDYRDYIES